MKRCELIRNVASTICMGALGFGIIGAAFMSLPETVSSVKCCISNGYHFFHNG
ncbi:hypothetical protein [Klebsiella phage Kpn6N]|nr:hypothetical protein [Klebsiella phage Kpn6N]